MANDPAPLNPRVPVVDVKDGRLTNYGFGVLQNLRSTVVGDNGDDQLGVEGLNEAVDNLDTQVAEILEDLAKVEDLANLSRVDGNVIIGDGTDFIVESGATFRASVGLSIGSDVQAFDADLAALAGLASTGIIARTSDGSAAVRTIVGAAPVVVANGSGVAGNPTVSVSPASDTAAGVIEIATNAEVATGTDTTRAVTPAGLAARVATTTATGIVELATSAEAIAGTDTDRAVTPAALAAFVQSGTWTPTLATDGTAFTSVTYNIQTGTYRRIGSLVFFNGSLRTSAVTVGAATGFVTIGGLPFSAIGGGQITVGQALSWAGEVPMAGTISSSVIYLSYRASVTGGTTLSAVADVGTGASANRIDFSGFYFTT